MKQVRRAKKISLNQSQLKATANLFLEVSKALALATIIGLVLPDIGGRVGLAGAIIGGVVVFISYLIAMWLLREVKK